MDPSILLILASVYSLSLASSNIPPPPYVTLNAIDVEIDETEDRRINLYPAGPIAACTDDDGDRTRGFIQSVSPSSPCGPKCFDLLPCAGTNPAVNSSEYCLFFEAGQGTLRYSSTPRYTLTIGCADDVETTATKSLTVTVVPNTPPVFDPPSPLNVVKTQDGTTTIPGAVLYNVVTNDIDGDAVYYTMSTNPNTPYIAIGYADGQIRATNDLKYMCQDSVQASVTARDAYNPAIGPMNINFKINPSNKAPYASNLDTTVSVDENVGAGFTVLTINVVDPNVYSKINFHMWSASDAGMEQYQLTTGTKTATLTTRINPNYERSDTRSVKLYFVVDDGYCEANKTYTLTVNIKDINEPPKYYPPSVEYLEVYEGSVDINPDLNINDPDINDVHTFSKVKGSAPEFEVDSQSGDIYSLTDIDIDPNQQFKDYTVVTNVTDKGGLSSTATVKITVYDANDNAPYFRPNAYVFAATECTEPGSVIGTVSADDDDSDYNNNDKLWFGGGGGKMTVMSKGSVVLTQRCINGESFTGSATVSDQGIYPGPLQGIPATISMTCGPCPPPTPAPTPKPAVTTTTTTKAPTTIQTSPKTTRAPVKISGDDSGITDLLAWLIPAILGGLAWLALTAYLIYRYCCPCRNIFADLCKRRPKRPKTPPKPKPPKEPKKPKTPKVVPPPPPPPLPPPPKAPTPPPPPPPLPEPEVDPYIYGFWKERFTDQDILNQPARAAKPEAVENMPSEAIIPRGNAPAPENLRLGNPGMGQRVPAPTNAPNNQKAKK